MSAALSTMEVPLLQQSRRYSRPKHNGSDAGLNTDIVRYHIKEL